MTASLFRKSLVSVDVGDNDEEKDDADDRKGDGDVDIRTISYHLVSVLQQFNFHVSSTVKVNRTVYRSCISINERIIDLRQFRIELPVKVQRL